MIRRFANGDEDAIAELWEELVRYHRELDPALPKATQDGGIAYAQRIVETQYDNYHRVYVAVRDGKVVGYVLGIMVDLLPEMFEQERAGFISDIVVSSEYRGQGIGRMLVTALEAWFRSLKVKHYEWTVAARNPSAITFWQALGGRDVMIRMRATLEDET